MVLTVLVMTRNVAKSHDGYRDDHYIQPYGPSILIRKLLRMVWIVINAVRMDFQMVKRDIRTRKVRMVVTVSKILDFAELSV